MKNIFNFDLRQKEKNTDYEKCRNATDFKNVTCLQKNNLPNSACAVATSPISKVAKSFVCSVPCCRATKHDQGAETGRSTTAQPQTNKTTPTKRNAKNSKQNIQIQNATQPSHFEAFKTPHFIPYFLASFPSRFSNFGILLHLQENSWCKSLSMSFAMSRSCHVVMSRDYVKSVNSLEEKTPTMHP